MLILNVSIYQSGSQYETDGTFTPCMKVWAELSKTSKNGTTSNRKPLPPPLCLKGQGKKTSRESIFRKLLKGAVTLLRGTQQTYGSDLDKRALRINMNQKLTKAIVEINKSKLISEYFNIVLLAICWELPSLVSEAVTPHD